MLIFDVTTEENNNDNYTYTDHTSSTKLEDVFRLEISQFKLTFTDT